ncbi:MAG: hypothetical protein D6719_04855 [Candidatus Dadabacteria bacterium]|nr:MAG: hypothetical protein D6719_04855 [Candidatus Dadabacteria bacterium]
MQESWTETLTSNVITFLKGFTVVFIIRVITIYWLDIRRYIPVLDDLVYAIVKFLLDVGEYCYSLIAPLLP